MPHHVVGEKSMVIITPYVNLRTDSSTNLKLNNLATNK